MRSFMTVFTFEYLNYLKSKSFIAVTAIMVIIAIAIPSVPTVIGLINRTGNGDSKSDSKTAVIIDNTGLYSVGDIEAGFSGYLFEAADRETAMNSLSAGELAFVMDITGEAEFKLYINEMNLMQFDLKSKADVAFLNVIKNGFLTDKGLSIEDVTSYYGLSVNGEIVTVLGAEDEQNQSGLSYTQKIIYAYILLFVLYFTLIIYGQYIVTTIVSEKSSKAMELLVTSTKPLNLMFGKVLGVGAAGLTQLSFMLVGAFVSFFINSRFWPELLFNELGIQSISELSGSNRDIGGLNSIIATIMTPASPAVLIYLIVFFIFGFFIYAFIYAAFASTASRIEEANTVQTLPMMLVIASFFVAILGLTNPGGTLTVVCSYIPFMTPMVMFMRICTDSVSETNAMISAFILVLSVFVTGYLSAKIYRVGILLYGKPPKISEIAKMLIKAKV